MGKFSALAVNVTIACGFIGGIGFVTLPAHGQQTINNDANALILANRAKGLKSQSSQSTESKQAARRVLQGSALGTLGSEASCGGVAIGNVQPVVGDHRQHETTVIIQGNVINTNNDC